MSVNKTILMGNLGNDPVIRYLPTGVPTATLSLATSDRWKDKSGEMKEKVQWHRVVIFGKAADVAQNYLKKGSPAYIEGRLNYRSYTDKEGIERYVVEIVCENLQLVGAKPKDDVDTPAPHQHANSPDPSQYDDGLSDDIPF